MQEAITAAGKDSGYVKRQVIGWAKKASLRGTQALMAGSVFNSELELLQQQKFFS